MLLEQPSLERAVMAGDVRRSEGMDMLLEEEEDDEEEDDEDEEEEKEGDEEHDDEKDEMKGNAEEEEEEEVEKAGDGYSGGDNGDVDEGDGRKCFVWVQSAFPLCGSYVPASIAYICVCVCVCVCVGTLPDD